MPSDKNIFAKNVLSGVHPVTEAIKSGRQIDRLLIVEGSGGARLQELIDLARDRRIPLRFESRAVLDRTAGMANHQGVVAITAAHRYAKLTEVELGPLVVAADGVEDPHNLGAIVRSAYAAGASCILIPERRAVGLTDTVAKAAAGALEYFPVVRVTNLNRALEDLKKEGYWIYGLDERGKESYSDVKYATPTVLVLGGEGDGLHQHTREHCDFLVRIPMHGEISSLNVSVAAGIAMFEWRKQQKG